MQGISGGAKYLRRGKSPLPVREDFEGRCVVWEGEPECVGVRNLWKGARTVGLDIVRDEKARFIGTQGIWGVPNSRCVTTTELSQT